MPRISSSWNTCLTPFPTDILNVQPKVDRSPFQGLLMRGTGATGGVWGLCTPWQNHYMLQLSKTCEKKQYCGLLLLVFGIFFVCQFIACCKEDRGHKRQRTTQHLHWLAAHNPSIVTAKDGQKKSMFWGAYQEEKQMKCYCHHLTDWLKNIQRERKKV